MSKDYNKNINPSHYTKGISVQEFNYSHSRNDLAGNCIKYLSRYDVKNPDDPLEDLYKCKQCLETLIALMEDDDKVNENMKKKQLTEQYKKDYKKFIEKQE